VETDRAREAATDRIAGSREYALATQIVAYDAAAVSQYAQALAGDNEALQNFLSETIVRPEFRPMIDEWRAQVAAGETPTNLLEDDDYLTDLFAASAALDASAAAATAEGEEAGANADDYVRLTLYFAASLFFAGITASFGTRLPRLMLLFLSIATLVLAGTLLAGYPVA
jgi:hypothetical protein